MNRKLFFAVLFALTLLLAGCAETEPAHETADVTDAAVSPPIDLSASEDLNFSLDDIVEGEYITLWSPMTTDTTQITVVNEADCAVLCDLFLEPDTEPSQTLTAQPGETITFSGLSGAQSYYLGFEPQGSILDVVISD